jgi:pimeloyl-ACP methyl ester carboxylesterase
MFKRTLPLDGQARAAASGQFIELADGFTNYELAGPDVAQVVVLVHGFSVPYYIWDPTFAALTAAGLRVLRYDLFGRGFSDRPKVIYNVDLFDRQLLGLLDALGMHSPIDLVGLSMGGAIAVHFADRHPERLRKLVLIDPAGLPMPRPAVAKLIQAPVLGDLLMSLFGDRFLLSSQGQDFRNPDRLVEFQAKYRVQLQYAGFTQAALSTIRHGPVYDETAVFQRVGALPLPILLIWGREDRTVPFEISDKARQALPNAEFQVIEEAGHIPHYEKPEAVNPIMLDFLL